MFWLTFVFVILLVITTIILRKRREGFGIKYTTSDFVLWPGFLDPIPKNVKIVNVLMKNSYQVEKVSTDNPIPTGKQKYCYMTDCPPEIETSNIKSPNMKIICWRCI